MSGLERLDGALLRFARCRPASTRALFRLLVHLSLAMTLLAAVGLTRPTPAPVGPDTSIQWTELPVR